ncbi:MAG: DUF559 domain-containing protein [Candidatus Kapabacteria bacterium]|nr:DUF559 domain-containing protein [Candidatus Kapabacteria bacterium]
MLKKIAFIPYSEIHEIFYQNDFNWNVTPSNYDTKEFKQIHDIIKSVIDKNALLFNFDNDKNELIKFIRVNFKESSRGLTKTRIDKNNFMIVYNKWISEVKNSININWDIAKKSGIIDGDFYLADLLSQENFTLKDKLYVLLKNDHYELEKILDSAGMFSHKTATFTDNQKAHNQFWNRYERPPKEEYWEYIVSRRDLLVPQDVRERKGSFYTPQIWVELSQKYLADTLGENWQDEYYIWDCAAGTGNLLNGLTNKYYIWASTLDKQDVEVMKDRIKNGANLLEDHVFQFDFLNDDFTKLPQELKKIINDTKKRKKLVMYINPPYAEATTAKTVSGTGENKSGVSTLNKANVFFKDKIGNASNEIFALFMAQIYYKIPDCTLAQFSKMKFIQGTNFIKFKDFFKAGYKNGFVVPAETFDNVKGSFPIGFTIWDLDKKEKIDEIPCDVYNNNVNQIRIKTFYGELPQSINKWLTNFYISNSKNYTAMLSSRGNDFQNQKFIYLAANIKNNTHDTKVNINEINSIPISIYFSVRHCIDATWLNDRDQFLYPNYGWESDLEFQNNCLAFTLFHGQNRISSKEGTNHWIPFTESEVDAKEKFESNFMTNFIKGKIKRDATTELNLFDSIETKNSPLWRGGLLQQDGVVLNSNTGEILKDGVLLNQSNVPPHLSGTPPQEGNLGKDTFNSPPMEEWQTMSDEVVLNSPSLDGNLKKRNTVNFISLPYNPKLKERAKELRKAGNLAEVLFWNEVKNGKFKGLDFDRQKIIGNYIVDFYCSNTNTVVEIDGSSHDDKQEYDAERDAFLIGLGLEVIHISDIDVKTNLSSVFKMLDEHPAFQENSIEEPPRLLQAKSTPPQDGNGLVFSPEAKAVFDAGRELWKYYHSQIKIPKFSNEVNNASVNASLYDIREYFQGRNAKGTMNSKSDDEEYMKLIKNLRDKLKILAKKIEPKVYEYGFLKE